MSVEPYQKPPFMDFHTSPTSHQEHLQKIRPYFWTAPWCRLRGTQCVKPVLAPNLTFHLKQMEIIMGKLVLAQNSPPQGQLEGLIEP